MKKIFAFLLIAVSVLCMACASGGGKATASASNTKKEAATPVADTAADEVPVVLEAGGKTFTAVLDNNEATERLLSRLPLDISMRVLGSSDSLVYGDEPIEIKNATVHGMNKGDIAYCQYGYLVVFYDNQSADHPIGYRKIGRVTSANVDELAVIKNGGNLRISKK